MQCAQPEKTTQNIVSPSFSFQCVTNEIIESDFGAHQSSGRHPIFSISHVNSVFGWPPLHILLPPNFELTQSSRNTGKNSNTPCPYLMNSTSYPNSLYIHTCIYKTIPLSTHTHTSTRVGRQTLSYTSYTHGFVNAGAQTIESTMCCLQVASPEVFQRLPSGPILSDR